ncbi:MAG: DNA-protecting protein DprA [Flexibacter sp. CG_4_10_14_3_um_filter_32_15]|nr:MAG: DNA-protecting protein DprA [Flexibacter sp. CG_4_10_14_3_um_filter_32_15]
MSDSRQFQVALSLLPHVGAKTAKLLISYCGSAEEVFSVSPSKILKIPNVGRQIANSIKENKTEVLHKAEKQLAIAEKQDVKILIYTDKDYPKRLLRHEDSPYILYYKGNADLNAQKTVGIVGTRKATEYGKEMTQKIVRDLTKYNPLIVSGLAYGVDIFSHRASLENGLDTIGVMANGLDKIYPAVHKNTAFEMIDQGGLLTEECFGTTPDAPRFPQRNRVIAGLSDVLIVVEAAAKGGALITAHIANAYNCEVFAVPGNLNSASSAGCNRLIRNHHAHIYTAVEDIEYILKWDLDEQNIPPIKKTTIQLTMEEQIIINKLEEVGGTMAIDNLSIKTQISLGELAGQLLMMEMKGIVKALPGKQFKVIS